MKSRLLHNLIKDPLTRRRLQRFKSHRRAYASFLILMGLYVLSLGAEMLCNDRPLFVRHEGRLYFPMLKFYPESTFTGSDKNTRPNYRTLRASATFADTPGNFMLFPPVPYGPHEILSTDELLDEELATLSLRPAPRTGYVNIAPDFKVLRARNAALFFGAAADEDLKGMVITNVWALPASLQQGIAKRFANEADPRVEATAAAHHPEHMPCDLALSTYRPRKGPPRSVRLTLREQQADEGALLSVSFSTNLDITGDPPAHWQALSSSTRSSLTAFVSEHFDVPTPQETWEIEGRPYLVSLSKNDISWPYKPTRNHWMGIDNAGRDVLARCVYAFRISVSFGLVLVIFSMLIGITMGAIQGYYGGALDITAQRLIEIWSALPFLYIMILMGSVFGRKFSVLMICYGLFNWIGISYYMRAEFFRLRRQPFVEAARCMGIPARKIMLRHILPNAITPAVTLFPFGLVSAIYALVALDYLGFGLPPLTPSWGEMLHQAQQHIEAWWLILYPSASLFFVMLLGVFIGEGIRDAFDPRQFSKME